MEENVYTYFAAFLRAAKKAGWSQEQINAVLDDACSDNYDHAVSVLVDAMGETEEAAIIY
jgi:hypothetical protein